MTLCVCVCECVHWSWALGWAPRIAGFCNLHTQQLPSCVTPPSLAPACNAVGICFFLALVNVVALLANPAWQRFCCSHKLKFWRHIKTWPPPWLGWCMSKEDEEEGAGADGEPRKPRQEEEDALHDTSIWGWQGLDARHFTDGFLGRWGMLMLRTLETILFLFTMIFQVSVSAVSDEDKSARKFRTPRVVSMGHD
eukprot:1160199-Pelagomonas_calceolata.AAC.1